MYSEAPLTSKALKLVSFALTLVIVSVAMVGGYSAYQEYSALSTFGTNQQGSANVSMSGNNLTISGISIPNKMSLPMRLEILGNASLEGSPIAIFDSGSQTLQPGQLS